MPGNLAFRGRDVSSNHLQRLMRVLTKHDVIWEREEAASDVERSWGLTNGGIGCRITGTEYPSFSWSLGAKG